MGLWDRVKAPLLAIGRAGTPRVDYFAMYAAKVVKQGGVRRVDVVPDDPRIPDMADIPLKLGLPGSAVRFGAGGRVLVGWENGDPSKPFAALWEGGESLIELQLGGENLTPQDGLVHGSGSDPYTGLPYWMLGNASTVVKGKK